MNSTTPLRTLLLCLAMTICSQLAFALSPCATGLLFSELAFLVPELNDPPLITGQPQSQPVCVGSNATFTVTVDGTAPFDFQWRKDGNNVGSNSNTLTINGVQLSDAGSYDVVVSNAFGSTTSDAATLTVNSPPVVTVASTENSGNPNDFTLCSFTAPGNPAVSLTASGGTTYLWSNLQTTATISDLTPGSYGVTVTNPGCPPVASGGLISFSPPLGGGAAQYVPQCGFISLAGGGNGNNFLWEGPNGYSSNTVNSLVNPPVSGVYTLTMSNSSTGCSAVVFTSPMVNVPAGDPFFNVTGGGAGCPGEGAAVGLDGSQTSASYQLYLGNTPVGSALVGTGSAFSFGNQQTAGTYTVLATLIGCPEILLMTGSAIVTISNCDDNDPCTNDICTNGVCSHIPTDADADGVPCPLDCDDNDPDNFPDNTEICDGQDNDCDAQSDEGCDDDNDGWCDANLGFSPNSACPNGAGDCDDSAIEIYPGAPELCDAVDNDCDGLVDENLATTYYFDQDNDGYGNNANSITVCITPPSGYITTGGDCDDGNGNINPGATEICNGFDDDCDGDTDEDAGATWYADTDGDGFGDANDSQQSCSQPMDYVGNPNDCDDGNASVTNCDDGNPCTTDACVNGACSNTPIDADGDGIFCGTDCNDNNPGIGICDDGNPCTADACVSGACVFTPIDNDGDGSPCGTDCDDNDNTSYPGATEACDGVDNDCDGQVDEGLMTTYFFDQDEDGYGNPANSLTLCIAPPTGYITTGGDCDDGNLNIFPGATEICNGFDDDCDGLTDETAGMIWYADADSDGFGNPAASTASCTQPSGYVPTAGDCNDSNGGIHPGATELCNGLDDDCDGLLDEGVSMVWYPDGDMDGYGNFSQTPFIGCTPPNSMYSTVGGDCEDGIATIHPNAPEICNYLDDDCDGLADEGLTFISYYDDLDGDGYGQYFIGNHCTPPANSSLLAGDCNNWNASVHPGATEVCNNLDDDCDGTIDEGVQGIFYLDSDNDGYGNPAITAGGCSPPNGFVTNNLDCNDGNAAIKPGATEVCNSVDDNCNGLINEGLTFLNYYSDNDHDGYGLYLLGNFCAAPANSTTQTGDCNDWNPAIHPGAPEICNWQDDDCDGQIDEGVGSTWYRDLDGDSYGNPAVTLVQCFQPWGYVSNSLDCNDNNAAIKPGATEICDGVDNNCNGQIDEGVATSFYRDFDEDGYGNPLVVNVGCVAPYGFVSNNLDCNDNNAAIKPGATEVCDGVDNNCDGIIDNVPAGKDLIVFSATAPSSATSGSSITVSGVIKNIGGTAVGNNKVRWYLSNDQAINSGDYSPTTGTVWNTATNTIAGCGTKNFSKTVTLPSGWTGTKYLIFYADAFGNVAETNEGNNLWIQTITINPAVGGGGTTGRALSFSVHPAGRSASLQWLAKFEQNVVGMKVERSAGGLDFEILMEISSALPTAGDARTYEAFDHDPLDGVNFYRIRYHLEDGSEAFSDIRSARFEPLGFEVFPNPAKEFVEVNLEKFAGKEGDLLISNSWGQVLWQRHLEAAPETPVRIDLAEIDAKSGLFQVSFIHLGKAVTRRLVVVRE